jgi:hypothetical protein
MQLSAGSTPADARIATHADDVAPALSQTSFSRARQLESDDAAVDGGVDGLGDCAAPPHDKRNALSAKARSRRVDFMEFKVRLPI